MADFSLFRESNMADMTSRSIRRFGVYMSFTVFWSFLARQQGESK